MFGDDKMTPRLSDDTGSPPLIRNDRIRSLLRLGFLKKGSPVTSKISHDQDQDSAQVDQTQLQHQMQGGASNTGGTQQSDPSPAGSDAIENLYSEEDLNRLGRQRPAQFSNAWSELAYCFCICMSQVLAVRFSLQYPYHSRQLL